MMMKMRKFMALLLSVLMLVNTMPLAALADTLEGVGVLPAGTKQDTAEPDVSDMLPKQDGMTVVPVDQTDASETLVMPLIVKPGVDAEVDIEEDLSRYSNTDWYTAPDSKIVFVGEEVYIRYRARVPKDSNGNTHYFALQGTYQIEGQDAKPVSYNTEKNEAGDGSYDSSSNWYTFSKTGNDYGMAFLNPFQPTEDMIGKTVTYTMNFYLWEEDQWKYVGQSQTVFTVMSADDQFDFNIQIFRAISTSPDGPWYFSSSEDFRVKSDSAGADDWYVKYRFVVTNWGGNDLGTYDDVTKQPQLGNNDGVKIEKDFYWYNSSNSAKLWYNKDTSVETKPFDVTPSGLENLTIVASTGSNSEGKTPQMSGETLYLPVGMSVTLAPEGDPAYKVPKAYDDTNSSTYKYKNYKQLIYEIKGTKTFDGGSVDVEKSMTGTLTSIRSGKFGYNLAIPSARFIDRNGADINDCTSDESFTVYDDQGHSAEVFGNNPSNGGAMKYYQKKNATVTNYDEGDDVHVIPVEPYDTSGTNTFLFWFDKRALESQDQIVLPGETIKRDGGGTHTIDAIWAYMKSEGGIYIYDSVDKEVSVSAFEISGEGTEYDATSLRSNITVTNYKATIVRKYNDANGSAKEQKWEVDVPVSVGGDVDEAFAKFVEKLETPQDVGVYEYTMSTVISINGGNGTHKDATISTKATLTILPRPIIVKANTKAYLYDGDPHTVIDTATGKDFTVKKNTEANTEEYFANGALKDEVKKAIDEAFKKATGQTSTPLDKVTYKLSDVYYSASQINTWENDNNDAKVSVVYGPNGDANEVYPGHYVATISLSGLGTQIDTNKFSFTDAADHTQEDYDFYYKTYYATGSNYVYIAYDGAEDIIPAYLEIDKKVVGDDNDATGKFTFVVYDENDAPVQFTKIDGKWTQTGTGAPGTEFTVEWPDNPNTPVLELLAGKKYTVREIVDDANKAERNGEKIKVSDEYRTSYSWTCSVYEPAGADHSVDDTAHNKTAANSATIPENHKATVTVTNRKVKEPKKGENVPAGAVADPEGTVHGKAVKVGDTITYQIDWENDAVNLDGTAKVAKVVVTDTIDTSKVAYEENSAKAFVNNVEFASAAITYANGTITWTLNDVPAGATGYVTFDVTVLEGAIGEVINNKANVTVDNVSRDTNEVENPTYDKTETAAGRVTSVTLTKVGDVYEGPAVVLDDFITYTIAWSNDAVDAQGNPTGAEVVITDTLEEGLKYISASSDVEAEFEQIEPSTLKWTIQAGPGAKGKVTLTVQVTEAALVNSRVGNTASIQVAGSTDKNTNTIENPVNKDPHITIEKEQAVNGGEATKDKLNVEAYDIVTYYLIITSDGYGAAENVVVSDVIPDGLIFVKNSISDGGEINGNTITWHFDEMPKDDVKRVSFQVKVPQVKQNTTWTNMGETWFSNNPENPKKPEDDPDAPDPEPKKMPSNPVVIEELVPEIIIEKTQAVNGGEATKDKLNVVAGDVVTYYLTITSKGSTAAKNVVVTDVIPDGLKLVENSISDNGTLTGNKITWELGNMGVPSSKTVSFKVTVPQVQEDTTWKNVGSTHYDNNPDNPPKPNDPNEPDPEPTEIPSNEVEIEELVPEIIIEKTQAVNGGEATKTKLNVEAGDVVTYYLTITSKGSTAAQNVVVTDEIPEGLTLVAGSISNDGKLTGSKITWNLGDIEKDTSVTVSFKVTVPQVDEDTTWKNVGSTHYDNNPKNPPKREKPDNPDDPNKPDDPNNPDDPDEPDEPLTEIPSNEVEIEELIPEITIEKTQAVNGGEATKAKLNVEAGDVVTYYLTITSKGSTAAKNVVVTDTIPEGLTLVAGSISNDGKLAGSKITWNLGDIEKDTSVTVSFKVTVPQVTEDTTWKNVGSTHYDNNPKNPPKREKPDNPDDPNNPDDPDEPDEPLTEIPSNEVEIEELIPEITIEKTQAVNGGEATKAKLNVEAGDVVTYYLTITSKGSTAAKNVVVTDAIPAGLTLVAGSISNDGKLNGSKITWNLGDIEKDTSVTVSFKVTVPQVAEDTTWKNVGSTHYDNNPKNPPKREKPDDPDDPNNPDDPDEPDEPLTEIPSNEVEIEELIPEITIEKMQAVNGGEATKAKLNVEAGDEVTYYLTVKNTGNGVAKNVVVKDEVPAGLKLVAGSISDKGTITGNKITWNLGDIAPEDSVTVSFKVTVPQVAEDTVWTNIASTHYDNNPDNPGAPGNPDDPANPDDPDASLTEIPSNEVEIEEKPKTPAPTATPAPTVAPDRTPTSTPNPSSPSTSTPKTGDESMMWLWLMLLAVSSVGIAGMLIGQKRRNRK